MEFNTFRNLVESTEEQRRTFFKLTFGENVEGYICIAYLEHTTRHMRMVYFKYPNELEDMLESISYASEKLVHVYFSSALYTNPTSKEKKNVSLCTNIWADLDTTDPRLLLVEPSILIETSPGHFQALWLLEDPVPPAEAEDVARRIAYYHADHGADKCWDAGHLLRVPYTPNYKYGDLQTAPVVSITHAKRTLYRLSDFSEYPNVAALKFMEDVTPIEGIPDEQADEIVARFATALPRSFYHLYEDEPTGDWSTALYRMVNICIEAGMSRAEAFIVANNAACNKYKRDQRPETELMRDVSRTYIKHMEKMQIAPTTNSENPEFLTAEEVRIAQTRGSFIERYIQWAGTLTDAPKQYHQAGAFIILSAILSGNLQLPTSFGTIRPNLWFMILAGSTITRKSTSMRIAMKLLHEVDERAEMATDGSMEGILVGLQDRPNQPSIFHRDEFTGLLDAIAHKDYMAGFAEQLTKLYDGDGIKRLLRKEVIEINDPVFIIYAGGIKDKTQMLLSEEHIMSGFIPRFVFITADTDPSAIEPTGPPRAIDNEARDVLVNELKDIHTHYVLPRTVTRNGKTVGNMAVIYDAVLTEEAWLRYNIFEKAMLDTAISTGLGFLLPVYDRLCTSTLKAALLISSSRQRPTGPVMVERDDIVHAIYYATRWRFYASEIVNGIGKSYDERLIDRIFATIREAPLGVSRAELMTMYRLDVKRADILFSTMTQRNMIYPIDVGGQKRYRAAEVI